MKKITYYFCDGGNICVTDIKSGERIMVFGQTNADGSVTAANIQINPTKVF